MDYPNDNKWKAHLTGLVTHGSNEHQVYQKENAIFNADGTMRLKAEYAGELIDTSEYTVPLGITKNPDHGPLYYRSGAICVGLQKFLYGYFEIKCKLPVNRGAFPAFWLWGQDSTYPYNYREIDVFEYSRGITMHEQNPGPVGSPRYHEGQIYYYNGTKPSNPDSYTYGRYYHYLPANVPDITNWHTYGVEWSPGLVKWYFDNQLIGSFKGSTVPSGSMNLVLNNAVDNWAIVGGVPISNGFPNEMVIDYVKVYKLNCSSNSCSTDKSIQNNSQLANFAYRVYRTITIGGYGYDIDMPPNSNTVFRATNGITINGNFDLPLGSSLELITHACP
jgi:beta-glucanase (GH16 family)